LADITDIPTGEGWLYPAVILDRFTRKIVGWARREHMRAELITGFIYLTTSMDGRRSIYSIPAAFPLISGRMEAS